MMHSHSKNDELLEGVIGHFADKGNTMITVSHIFIQLILSLATHHSVGSSMAETLHVTQTVFISNITVLVTLNVLVLVITLNVLVLVVVFKVISMFNLADNFNVSDSVVTLNVPVLVTLNVCPSFYFKCFISFCYFHCFYPSCVPIV